MKILITGGAGLIGQAVAKKHLKEGDDVFIYDNKSNIYNDYSNIVGEDISYLNFSYIFKTFNPDVISHHASYVSVGESQYEIYKYVKNNVEFTSFLLDSILKSSYKPKKLILAGSMGIYGEGEVRCNNCNKTYLIDMRKTLSTTCKECRSELSFLKIHEDSPKCPQSIYAVTKKTQEDLFKIFSELYNIPTICLRYFSVYGTQCNPNNPFTGVLSIIANKIINSDVIELNENGLQTRDLVHIDDCAEAHFNATRVSLENSYVPLNVGTGKRHTLLDVANMMIQQFNINKKIIFNNKIRKGDIKHSCADISKAKKYLNWNPKIRLEDSICQYFFYIKNNWNKFFKKDTCKSADEKLEKYNLFI